MEKNTENNELNNQNKEEEEGRVKQANNLPLGLGFGLLYGIITDNIPLGLSLGLCFGLLIKRKVKQ